MAMEMPLWVLELSRWTMTFRMRTTHLPSARLLGVPPWLRRLLPHGIYPVGLGHKVPSFGRGREKVRVVVSAFAIVFSRELFEHGEGQRQRRKKTNSNERLALWVSI